MQNSLKTRNLRNKNLKFIIISNTSKYLKHYRLLLLKKVKNKFNESYIFAPEDSFSKELESIITFKNWNLESMNEYSFLNLLQSFYQLFIFTKKIKPFIVHSHTLKPNLLVSIVNFFFGINTVISFPGMGKLSNSKGLKYFLFKLILRIIHISSIHKFKKPFYLEKSYGRVKFIFQNPNDLNLFVKTVNANKENHNYFLIPGSGVPEKYQNSIRINLNERKDNYDFIYCARLIKSKGIKIFIDLSTNFPESKFYIYGNLKGFEDDYLSEEEIRFYQQKYKNLLFMGYVNDPLLNHHNDNSIFIIPSNYGEGLPRGILEAMTLEIPVVASKKSCVGLFDERNIFQVSDNKITSYLKVIKLILKMKKDGYLDKFLINSKNFVNKNYKESIVVEKTMALYEGFNS